jgi:plasmid stabilization system protein ParE
MARIEVAPEGADDLDRIFDYLAQHDPDGAASRIREIIQAISVLETNPLIGRPARRNKCELVIGRRAHGYMALYRYVPEVDAVFVLALRSQREAGYKRT